MHKIPYKQCYNKKSVNVATEQKATHYENLYKSLILTSSFSHLREHKNIQGDLLQFNSGTAHYTTIEEKEFNKMFSSENQKSAEDSIQNLSTMFPDLFKEE